MPREAELNERGARIRVVAGILLDAEDMVLISDRSRARSMQEYWEFPGGKVDPRESGTAALGRELKEELGIRVIESCHLHRVAHDYPDLLVAIDFYVVTTWEGKPAGKEGQRIKWVAKSRLTEAALLPADAPVIDVLCRET